MKRALRICLITSGHVASTPRLVKAADTLQAAGHAVHVVASDHYAPVRLLDRAVLQRAAWACTLLPADRAGQRLWHRIARQLARQGLRAGSRNLTLAAVVNHSRHVTLARLAARVPADLYLGHTLGGLTAAHAAARDRNAWLGFDAEDWHRGELAPDQAGPGDGLARAVIEDALVPQCRHLTAASPMIAAAYAGLWGRNPVVLLNTFPLSEAPAGPVPDSGRQHSLYWFSQTIGPGRGLEAAVAALALLPAIWRLQLRGTPAEGYAAHLEDVARRHRVPGRIDFLPPAAPDEMVRLAAPHRIGLALEELQPPNRALCLTNKIFTYLLAGTPTLLSRTPAQEAMAVTCGPAAALVDLDRPTGWLSALQQLDTPVARAQAWQLGQTRYHWENDAALLLSAIDELASPPRR